MDEDTRVAAAGAASRQGSGEIELDGSLSLENGLMLRTCIGRETPPGAFDAMDDDSSSSLAPPWLDLNSAAAPPAGGTGAPASVSLEHIDLSNQRSILVQEVASAQLDAAFRPFEDDDSMECGYPDEPRDDDSDSPEGGFASGIPAGTTSESKSSSWKRMPFMEKVSAVEWMPRSLSQATAAAGAPETRTARASSASGSAPKAKRIAKTVGSNVKAAGSTAAASAQRAMMRTHSAMGRAKGAVFTGLSNTLTMKPSAEKAPQSGNGLE